jgi:hypothetical protein
MAVRLAILFAAGIAVGVAGALTLDLRGGTDRDSWISPCEIEAAIRAQLQHPDNSADEECIANVGGRLRPLLEDWVLNLRPARIELKGWLIGWSWADETPVPVPVGARRLANQYVGIGGGGWYSLWLMRAK